MHTWQWPPKHAVLRMVYPHNNLERDYYVAHTPTLAISGMVGEGNGGASTIATSTTSAKT
jgi:hypothetical protein